MKYLQLLIILTLVASCGLVQKEQVKKLSVNEEMEPYFQCFSELYGKNIDDLDMKFAKSISNENPALITLGYCQQGTKTVFTAKKTYEYATPVIVLNKAMWDSMDASKRERLVFHEMGHCILGRGHTETQNSIMNAYANMVNLAYGYSNLVSELFGRTNMAGVNFEGYRYASTALASTHSENLGDIVIPELHDCTHDKGHEVIDERVPASVEEK